MIHAILAIHGAIDEVLRDSPEHREVASRYLGFYGDPDYDDPDEPGWFSFARELVDGHRVDGPSDDDPDVRVSAFPSLDEALEQVAGFGANALVATSPAACARLLVAVAILVRIEELVGERREQLLGALTPVVVGNDVEQARALLELLGDDQVFGSSQEWDVFLERSIGAGLLPTLMIGTAAPCSGTTVTIADGTEVAELRTEYRSAHLTVGQVAGVLDPLNWPACSPYFCNMVALPSRDDGWDHVLETASTLCGVYALVTGIKYFKFERPDGRIGLNYDLSDPQPLGADHAVEVDRGYILVRPTNPGVVIVTSKQVRFRSKTRTAAMGMFGCMAGWGDAVEHVLSGCAQGGGGTVPWLVSQAPVAPVAPEERVERVVERVRSDIDALGASWSAYVRRASGGTATLGDMTALVADIAGRTVGATVETAELAARLGASVSPRWSAAVKPSAGAAPEQGAPEQGAPEQGTPEGGVR